MDYILKYEDSLSTETNGYAVFYPNDGLLTAVGSLASATQHHADLKHLFPDSYVVFVGVRRANSW